MIGDVSMNSLVVFVIGDVAGETGGRGNSCTMFCFVADD